MLSHSQFNLASLSGATLNAALVLALLVAWCVLSLSLVALAKATYRAHRAGATLPASLGRATVETYLRAPLALHRRRMAAVARYEAARADAVEQALLAHPTNHRARLAAIADHPAGGSAAHLHLIHGGGGAA